MADTNYKMASKEKIVTNSRGNWTNWGEFFLSCLGYMVGLGNIWRFPYLCYRNGGGAFLIPYFTFLIVCGIPLLCLEFTCCQFSNLGPGKVWIMCPLFKGIGIGMLVLNCICSIYYTVIISWALYYLVMSFSTVLPWSTCDNEWNTPGCYIRISVQDNVNATATQKFSNSSSTGLIDAALKSILSTTSPKDDFTTYNITNFTIAASKTPSEEFWDYHVLDRSEGIDKMGVIRWQLLLCLLASWTVAFLCFIKGIKTSGKVMYVASTAPYIMLTILLVRGLFLSGAEDGLRYYMIPKWERLLHTSVWTEAAAQVFYSIGLGTGNVATVASYNKFHNNIIRDTVLLSLLDGFTSLFSGMVIFVTLGFMAKQSNLEIGEVVSQGPGIAFMVYPEALAQLPIPQLWSVCFFLLLFTVGLNSQIVHLQALSSGIMDNIPRLAKKYIIVNLVVCIPSFGIAIFCITQGGVYVLQLMDWYTASICLMLFSLLQVVVLAYVYGTNRLYEDMELMLGKRPSIVWKIAWLVVCPITLIFLWIMYLVKMKRVYYGDYTFPAWSIGVGWLIAIIPIVVFLLCILHTLWNASGSLIQRIQRSVKPTYEWGPAPKELRDVYRRRHPNEAFPRDASEWNDHEMKHML